MEINPKRVAVCHGRTEVVLPEDLMDGAQRGPLAGSYLKGANAALAGKPKHSNPYPPGDDADAWNRGFDDRG